MPINISELQSIEWGPSYLWEINIEGCPLAFFPVSEVEEPIASLDSKEFTTSNYSFKVPQLKPDEPMQVTFYDDVQGSLKNFIEDWINNVILLNGEGINYLESSCKTLTLIKFDRQHVVLSRKNYLVYPNGSFSFNGSSESGLLAYTLQFVIAGEL